MGKVLLVTQDWPGLGLAILMMDQGSDVSVIHIPDPKERAKDKEAHELLGDGLVDKITWDESKIYRGKDTLWLFDSNRLPKQAQELIDAGELVLGSGKLAAMMEDDRDEAVKIAKEVGFDIPFTQEFTDYAEALKFLKGEASRSFVYKPYKADPTGTFVPQAHTAPEGNKEVQAYVECLQEHAEVAKPQFILQEQIFGGVEANFELWVRKGKPLLALCDLESKRKLVGDLGVNIGCAGDYVYPVEMGSRGVRMTVLKYLKHPSLRDYTGSVDANVIFHKSKVYFLENCFRMGFNAYATIFNGLSLAKAEDIFREWAGGKKKSLEGALLDGYAASLTVTCDHPVSGYPITIPNSKRGYYLYRAYKEKDKLVMVEGWPEVLCTVAYAKTMEAAGDRALALAKVVGLPNKGYRTDLVDNDQPYLPITRQHKIEALGLIAY